MTRLLIDIGNTRIKGCIAEDKELGIVQSKNYIKTEFEKEFINFLNLFSNLSLGKDFIDRNPAGIIPLYISNLDNGTREIILSAAKDYEIHFVNAGIQLPIKIDYANTLGSDRICSAAGAYGKFSEKENILIIDFGTATTFNLVSKGVYSGGMISAGIKTSADALINKTTLPDVTLNKDIRLINKDTDSAIISGLIFQQVLFVKKAIEEYKNLFKELYVVATGGGLDLIKNHETGIDIFEPYLVLEGLNFIGIYNETIR